MKSIASLWALLGDRIFKSAIKGIEESANTKYIGFFLDYRYCRKVVEKCLKH